MKLNQEERDPPQAGQHDGPDHENMRLRQENARLRQENARLRQETARLRQETARLRQENPKLQEDLDRAELLLERQEDDLWRQHACVYGTGDWDAPDPRIRPTDEELRKRIVTKRQARASRRAAATSREGEK